MSSVQYRTQHTDEAYARNGSAAHRGSGRFANRLIRSSTRQTLARCPFILVIYLDKAATTLPKLIMEFSRMDRFWEAVRQSFLHRRQDGRIQYVATVPTASLAPGAYSVRFIVNQGSETAEEGSVVSLCNKPRMKISRREFLWSGLAVGADKAFLFDSRRPTSPYFYRSRRQQAGFIGSTKTPCPKIVIYPKRWDRDAHF